MIESFFRSDELISISIVCYCEKTVFNTIVNPFDAKCIEDIIPKVEDMRSEIHGIY